MSVLYTVFVETPTEFSTGYGGNPESNTNSYCIGHYVDQFKGDISSLRAAVKQVCDHNRLGMPFVPTNTSFPGVTFKLVECNLQRDFSERFRCGQSGRFTFADPDALVWTYSSFDALEEAVDTQSELGKARKRTKLDAALKELEMKKLVLEKEMQKLG